MHRVFPACLRWMTTAADTPTRAACWSWRPVHQVDISIIRGIDSDPDKQQILRNVVRYAQPRSMQIIAEGVETAAEMRTVIDLGADLLQGYFLARPAAVPDPIAPEAAEIIRAIQDSDRRKRF